VSLQLNTFIICQQLNTLNQRKFNQITKLLSNKRSAATAQKENPLHIKQSLTLLYCGKFEELLVRLYNNFKEPLNLKKNHIWFLVLIGLKSA